MDFGPLRALALDLNLQAHGVPATVKRLHEPEIATRVIWLVPLDEEVPTGLSIRRSEMRRVMAIPRDEVPAVPTGTIIVAPEQAGQTARAWKVDSFERREPDHHRAVVTLVS